MTRKTIYLGTMLFMLLLILSMNIGSITAQEPTDEADPVVSEGGGITVVSPEEGGSVTVVQPAANETEPRDFQDYINTILAVAAFVASAMVFLSTRQREQVIGGAEQVEHYGWLGVTTLSKIVQALGGRPDFETSNDPVALAQALINKEMNVVISKDVDVDKVFAEYNRQRTR